MQWGHRDRGRAGLTLIAFVAALLAGCGGGGGSASAAVSNPAPAVTETPSASLAAPSAGTVAPATPAPLPAAASVPQLAQIVHMGQSLAAGQDAFPLLSATDTGFGNFRFARGVHTWRMQDGAAAAAPQSRPESDFALVPLTSGDPVNHYGETIANGLADPLKAWWPAPAPQFLFAFAGEGNRRLRELDKRHDASRDPRSLRPGPGGYYATSIDNVRRARAQALARGWTHSVLALTWMQGEADADLRPDDWSPAQDLAAATDRYATDLIALKDDLNADVLAITAQPARVPLFTYQTGYGMAGLGQLAAAGRDPEVHVVAPVYPLPNALEAVQPDGQGWGSLNHLTSDGERWLGVQFAKALRRQLVQGESWVPLQPQRAWASADRRTVFVRYAVPRPPLVVDTSFLPALRQRGFALTDGSPVLDVTVADDRTLALQLGAALAPGAALDYAWNTGSTEIAFLPVPIREVRPGAPWPNGHPSYELVFSGDSRALVEAVLRCGPFVLGASTADGGPVDAVIREVSLDAQGNTVLRGDAGEVLQGAFVAGRFAVMRTVLPSGNVRDSDPETAPYTFAFGTRKGQPYPLWNWSVRFAGFPIDDR